jgi:hypothetical protein
MTISQTTQELLKAQAGRGVSNDPELLVRSKVRLLQNTSKMPKHGQGAAGLFCLPDESLSCTSKLRVIPGILYTTFVERPDDKSAPPEHYVLPPGAEQDGYRWRLPNGNAIEQEARIAGLFNGLEAEFDLRATGMKVARGLNSDGRSRAKKLGIPIYALAFEFSSLECTNDRGQLYYSVAFEFLGAVGDPEGPTETEVIRAAALCDLVEATIAEAKREAEDRRSAPSTNSGLTPRNIGPRPLITSGNAALKLVEAPPPVEYDGPDDDSIPF